jgi:hypothetical protein
VNISSSLLTIFPRMLFLSHLIHRGRLPETCRKTGSDAVPAGVARNHALGRHGLRPSGTMTRPLGASSRQGLKARTPVSADRSRKAPRRSAERRAPSQRARRVLADADCLVRLFGAPFPRVFRGEMETRAHRIAPREVNACLKNTLLFRSGTLSFSTSPLWRRVMGHLRKTWRQGIRSTPSPVLAALELPRGERGKKEVLVPAIHVFMVSGVVNTRLRTIRQGSECRLLNPFFPPPR